MIIDKLMENGAGFLGSRFPILCGAMTWVSNPELVTAVGAAGGFGLLAGGNMEAEGFRDQILRTRSLSSHPFGVNLVTVAPNYVDQLHMVTEMECPIVVFAGAIPKSRELEMVKQKGAKVICFAATEALAYRLIAQGADALMLEGSEAGGHIGPVSLTVLLQQILFKIDTIPVFVAGGVATGKMMAHLLTMGAWGIQMGTRFVMSQECTAHYRFKEAFIKARARDALATPQFDSRLPVIPVRALKNQGSEAFSRLQLELIQRLENGTLNRQEAQHEVERFWMGALRNAVIEGDASGGSLMAGQSVGLVDEIMPLQKIIDELLEEGEAELQKMKGMLGQ